MAYSEYNFLTTQIERAQAAVLAYNDALVALGTSGIQSYTLDTGQSKQTVTRANLTEINNVIDSLNNRIVTLTARRDGCAAFTGGPGW